MQQYKMVMFDMDGTIVDSFNFHQKVFQKFLKKYDVHLDLDEVGSLIGNTMKHILSETLPEEKHDEAYAYLSSFYTDHVDDLIEDLIVIEGAIEVLEYINRKTKVSLVTNSKKELVERILHIKGLDNLFIDVAAADKESLDKKQRCTDLFEKYKIAPGEVLYIGDSSHDVILSKKVGMKCCLINNKTSWINKDNFNIETEPPEYVVEDIRECIKLVG